MTEDFYCKVYLSGDVDLASLRAHIVMTTGGVVEGRTVRAGDLLIDIFQNLRPEASASEEDFVQWPFYLEIEASEDRPFNRSSLVASLAYLLTSLRARGLRLVLSGDCEAVLKEFTA